MPRDPLSGDGEWGEAALPGGALRRPLALAQGPMRSRQLLALGRVCARGRLRHAVQPPEHLLVCLRAEALSHAQRATAVEVARDRDRVLRLAALDAAHLAAAEVVVVLWRLRRELLPRLRLRRVRVVVRWCLAFAAVELRRSSSVGLSSRLAHVLSSHPDEVGVALVVRLWLLDFSIVIGWRRHDWRLQLGWHLGERILHLLHGRHGLQVICKIHLALHLVTSTCRLATIIVRHAVCAHLWWSGAGVISIGNGANCCDATLPAPASTALASATASARASARAATTTATSGHERALAEGVGSDDGVLDHLVGVDRGCCEAQRFRHRWLPENAQPLEANNLG
eukprot:1749298-Pyramimonas_sp.AAC.2